jgi:peptidoglycan/xylan/chitin deacetylase (PgdA/CDA1 family)
MSVGLSIAGTLGRLLPQARLNRLVVLIYHRVLPQRDSMFPREIIESEFDAQMGAIARYCSPVALSKAVQLLKAGALPPRAVAVTFDDGYADNASVALPLLRKHGVPATFFIATAFLNGGRMWNDTVSEAIRRWPRQDMDAAHLGLGMLPLGSPVAKGAAASAVLRAIKHRSPDERLGLAADLAKGAIGPLPDDLMMTTAHVRELHAAGMEIGAHTRTHPILRLLNDADSVAEIAGNIAELEEIIQQPVRAFAYPNGRPLEDYEPRHRQLVESLRLDYAVSTRRGVAHGGSDPYELPRFTPWDRDISKWLARLVLEYRNPQ